MKKLSLLILVVLFAGCVALAQDPNGYSSVPSNSTAGTGAPTGKGVAPGSGTPSTAYNNYGPGITPPVINSGDVLGAHLGYGRGCVMCHAPHGGSAGNGVSNSDSSNGTVALWGQSLANLYGKSVTFATDHGTAYKVTLPTAAAMATSPAATTIMMCLSCHDGATATVGMMKGLTVETLPIVGGNAPTTFGTTPGNTATALTYVNEHPVGPSAVISCSGTTGTVSNSWDCTGGGASGAAIAPATGGLMAQFVINNQSSFWNYNAAEGYPLVAFGTTANAVSCTTCHNQHSMNVYRNTNGSYTTMFFINGYYNPYSGGNNVAQFCRNCHAGESNEASGLLNIPTT